MSYAPIGLCETKRAAVWWLFFVVHSSDFDRQRKDIHRFRISQQSERQSIIFYPLHELIDKAQKDLTNRFSYWSSYVTLQQITDVENINLKI